mgnify:CR=1 FL=1|jgi:hypothetical protein
MLVRAQFKVKPSITLAKVAAIVWVVLSFCSFGIFQNLWFALAYSAFALELTRRWVLRYALLKSDNSVVGISFTPEEFCFYLNNGDQITGQMMPKSALHPLFISLFIVDASGKKFWLALTQDSAMPDDLRRLRVFGRWYTQAPLVL